MMETVILVLTECTQKVLIRLGKIYQNKTNLLCTKKNSVYIIRFTEVNFGPV